MVKAALYCRVSKTDQNPELQREALLHRAKVEEWEYELFEEKESSRNARPVKYHLYQQLLEKEFDAVVVWKLDRWARSLDELVREVTLLFDRKIQFISLTEHLDLGSAQGTLLFHILSAFAQFERSIISERTKEGLKYAKNVGKRGKDKGPRKTGGYLRRWDKKRVPPKIVYPPSEKV